MFIKSNSSPYQDALLKEADGLSLLSAAVAANKISELRIVSVQSVSTEKLILEPIAAQSPSRLQQQQLGAGLAKLHAVEQQQFGLGYDNYIGLNQQKNSWQDCWATFFLLYRLAPQISWIKEADFKSYCEGQVASLTPSIKNWLSDVRPSLVHGDLWSGNVLFDESGPVLIDPAVYYGDAEVDIAMTEMFGGFTAEFYQAYQDYSPLSVHYPQKKTVYNLYHYLNHYNLFGDSYKGNCIALLESLSN